LCKREMLKEKLKRIWYRLARWGCRIFCTLFFRLKVFGRENVPAKGAVLLVSNHQSYLDPVFCAVALERQINFVARKTLFRNWFFTLLISSLNAIPVRRDEADVTAIKNVISRLKQGGAVCLFPEATRTSNGRISDFKPGFGLLCRRGEAAVVPILIDGAFECWPRHKKIFSPGPVTVSYGKAITARQARNLSDKKLAQILTDTLRKMQRQIQTGQGKDTISYS